MLCSTEKVWQISTQPTQQFHHILTQKGPKNNHGASPFSLQHRINSGTGLLHATCQRMAGTCVANFGLDRLGKNANETRRKHKNAALFGPFISFGRSFLGLHRLNGWFLFMKKVVYASLLLRNPVGCTGKVAMVAHLTICRVLQYAARYCISILYIYIRIHIHIYIHIYTYIYTS